MKAKGKGYGCGKKVMQADDVMEEDAGDRERWRQVMGCFDPQMPQSRRAMEYFICL